MIDCGAHRPAEGYKMLLESGPTMQTALPRSQAAAGWCLSFLPLLGTPAGYIQPQCKEHTEYSVWEE